MPEYQRPLLEESKALEIKANASADEGVETGVLSDKYIRLTVLLAGVLFLVGIGSTFTMVSLRYGLIGVGLALLVVAAINLIGLPQPNFNLEPPSDVTENA
jgi:hypothetical protein